MQIASKNQSEIRLTVETAVEMINTLATDKLDTRATLVEHGFTRADHASHASMERLTDRLGELAPFLRSLPDIDEGAAAEGINEQLTELRIAPSIVDHGGVGPHMHWTPSTATFDDQVMADITMAVAHELCENGTIRFGRCGASDCSDLFYDGTRNRSRRFCDDPRCASKTHTADHRARKRSKES